MADEDEELNEKNSVVTQETPTSYKRYPLKPTTWQWVKENLTDHDKAIQLKILRDRKLRVTGQDE